MHGESEMIPKLATEAASKIVLLVMDGLGGMRTAARASELHDARTPNLDQIAREGSSGLHTVVAPGITPGSGAGHLALFGYDPLVYELGRGALSAAGLGFDLKLGDVAARVNFATIDSSGACSDRRAGRISTEENERLCNKILNRLDLGGRAQPFLVTERDHRALLVLRGEGLSPDLSDSDPGVTGVAPLDPTPLTKEAEPTALLLSALLRQVRDILENENANFILLRGFDTLRELPSFKQRYRLDALGIAGYPMYIGISRILGMTVAPPQKSFSEALTTLAESFQSHDFFYVHCKETDSPGEDGDFEGKVKAIEEVDAEVPRILGLRPDVLCVTADHSTPSQLRGHSWHPVPFVLWGPRVGIDGASRFDEDSARTGGYGHILCKDLMSLMLAAAGRLKKFGA